METDSEPTNPKYAACYSSLYKRVAFLVPLKLSFLTTLSLTDLEERNLEQMRVAAQRLLTPTWVSPSTLVHTRSVANEARRDLIYGASFLLML